jgi:hypothetical protein
VPGWSAKSFDFFPVFFSGEAHTLARPSNPDPTPTEATVGKVVTKDGAAAVPPRAKIYLKKTLFLVAA